MLRDSTVRLFLMLTCFSEQAFIRAREYQCKINPSAAGVWGQCLGFSIPGCNGLTLCLMVHKSFERSCARVNQVIHNQKIQFCLWLGRQGPNDLSTAYKVCVQLRDCPTDTRKVII